MIIYMRGIWWIYQMWKSNLWKVAHTSEIENQYTRVSARSPRISDIYRYIYFSFFLNQNAYTYQHFLVLNIIFVYLPCRAFSPSGACIVIVFSSSSKSTWFSCMFHDKKPERNANIYNKTYKRNILQHTRKECFV